MLPTGKRHRLVAIIGLSLLLALSPQIVALETGIGGASVNGGCNCHSSQADESVIPTIAGLPEAFEAGEIYVLDISFDGGPDAEGDNQGGFNLKADRGSLSAVDETGRIIL